MGALCAGRGAGRSLTAGWRAAWSERLKMGLARLERTAAHDAMLDRGRLDRRGSRRHHDLGSGHGLDRHRRLRDRHDRRRLDDRRGRDRGLGDGDD